MDDKSFASQTLKDFALRAAHDVDLLRRTALSGDTLEVKRVAHNLKSVAAHVGAGSLREIAFEIEQAGARADLQFMELALTRLDVETRRCAAFIPSAIEGLAVAAISANHQDEKR